MIHLQQREGAGNLNNKTMAAALSRWSAVTKIANSSRFLSIPVTAAGAITTTISSTAASPTSPPARNSSTTTTKRAELGDDEDVATIFQVLNKSQTKEQLVQSLSSTGILLTNTLIERVLLRCRFSHGNPIAAFNLYSLTSLRRGFFHSPLSLETLLYILGRSRLFPLCLHSLRRSHRTLVTPRALHVLLSRVAKVCSLRQTLHTFRHCARLLSNHPPATVFNALLRSLAQERSMEDARSAYHLLKRRFPPDLTTFNILLSGWRSPEDARSFFQEMLDLNVTPDLVSFNCLIQCHCKSSEIEKAQELLHEMRDRYQIEPDVVTYTILIGGLGLAGRPDAAVELLREMREYGCYPDTAAYNAAIRNLCIARRLNDGFSLLVEMKEKAKLRPNATTFNLFFRCLYWTNNWNKAWELYLGMREVERCLPNTQTCMFLVKLFRRHGKLDMALRLWEDMVEEGFGSLPLASDVLFDLLCDEGKVVEAERCFLQLVEKGHRPSFHSFKRIKVLLELAKMEASIENLSRKMANFRYPSSPWSERCFISDRDIEESTRKWHSASI